MSKALKNADILKADEYENKIKPPSLRNIGANCYLNSALQGLSSCDKFVKEINILYENEKSHIQSCEKLSLFYHLISLLNGSHAGPLEISRNHIFKSWNKHGQQDSFELLSYVLNQVYNELRKKKEDSGHIRKKDLQGWLQFHLPMRILIQYQMKCGCGIHIPVPLQSDLALHVTIPLEGEMNLQVLVDKFFDDDKIEDYECDAEGCSQSSQASRSTRLCRPLPSTICIHLQRTYWNGSFMKKIKNKISFKDKLIIKSKFCVPQKQTESEISKEKLLSNNDKIMDKGKPTNISDVNNIISEVNHVFDNNDNVQKHSSSYNYQEIENSVNNEINSEVLKDNESDSNSLEVTGANSPNISEIRESEDLNELMETNDDKVIEIKNGKGNESDSNSLEVTGANSPNISEIRESEDLNESMETNDDEVIEIKNGKGNESDSKSLEVIGPNSSNISDIRQNEDLDKSMENCNTCFDEKVASDEVDEVFNLTSVIVHSGSVDFGHYTCYKCINNQWFLTNDSFVRDVDTKAVFGCEAYILFYEKP